MGFVLKFMKAFTMKRIITLLLCVIMYCNNNGMKRDMPMDQPTQPPLKKNTFTHSMLTLKKMSLEERQQIFNNFLVYGNHDYVLPLPNQNELAWDFICRGTIHSHKPFAEQLYDYYLTQNH